MAKLFIFGIGGTGTRIIKSLTMLLASGLKSTNNFEIVPIIIDPHKDNEDLKRTIVALNNYQKITELAGLDNGFFGTKISTLQSLDPDNRLSGAYTFKLKEVSNAKFKDYFSYNSLSDESKAFADLLFSGKTVDIHGSSIDLLDIPMDIGFVGSDGFNEACCDLKRHETEYCMRHLRYATKEGVEKRKSMNYFQDYFLQNHATIPYSPNEKVNYYSR
jgi:hypothetical protein